MDPEQIWIKVLAKYDTKVMLLEKPVDPLMFAAQWIEISIHDFKSNWSKFNISVVWEININKYGFCSKWKWDFEVSHKQGKCHTAPF